MRILVVEDDELTARALSTILTQQNYVVEAARDGESAWALADSFQFDLILLDVMIPRLDGITLCRRLRSQGYQMPILLLTGKDSSHDKTVGLDAGADDYVVKPFDPEELSARVRALLRRSSVVAQPVLEWGELRLDPSSFEVTYEGNLLALTPKEYALLELFLRNHHRVFSCGVILEQLWSFEETPGEEAVRTHIKGLRQKLKAADAPADLVETVYGIGYRLKPRDATESASKSGKAIKAQGKAESSPSAKAAKAAAIASSVSSPTAPSPTSTQHTITAIAKIWERFKGRVYQQIEGVEEAIIALSTGSLSTELQQQAIQEAHSLAGSLGTFGFPNGSKLARQIEHRFMEPDLQSEAVAHLQPLMRALRQAISEPPNLHPSTPAAPETPHRPQILIVDRDDAIAQQVTTAALHWGMTTHHVSSLAAARKQVTQERPQIVLLDLAVARSPEESLVWLRELSQQNPPLPVLVLTERSDLSDRLEVARLGGRAFLRKPVSVDQVLEAVNQALQQANQGKNPLGVEARVMVVDDDPAILELLRNLLEPWGFQVITLDDPRHFWDVLETAMPNLLVLDIKMPHVNGVELCQVARNDPRWSSLPILFLTAYTDPDTLHQVFAMGADDFVCKPIVGPELLIRILNRLDRMKYLRRLAETDPLTHVSNRYKSTQDLERLLRLAQRRREPLSLVVLDLDHFRQVNNRWGHAVGDEVLRQFAQRMKQEFRGEDVVARWGGEEFVLGLYGMTLEDAVRRLNRFLQSLRSDSLMTSEITSDQITSNQQPLSITFSAGIAQYPEDGDTLQSLYQAADTEMYQAKQAGRNRVFPAIAPNPPALPRVTEKPSKIPNPKSV